ncbi:MAG: cobalamin biosynthesis protein CobD/CbiB [Acidiferrobacterales bacterium]
MIYILFTILLAILLDRMAPNRNGVRIWSWYGDWAESIEQRFNGGTRVQGISAVFIAVAPLLVAVFLADLILGEIIWVLKFIFDVVVVYLCVDLYRLGRSAQAVSTALDNGDIADAEAHLRELIGKETPEHTDAAVARATVEAVLKQANSLVIAPLFWFVILGPVGTVLQRMASALDRQWGHRSARFAEFGWAAARMDDLLGWIPARITALSYAIMGSFEDALHCWRRQAGMWSDINSGPLLASGFGAMHLDSCEEPEEDAYGNKIISRTSSTDAGDVRRVVALVWRVLLFWLGVAILMLGAHLFGFFVR